MNISRGLFALIFIFVCNTALFSQYLYKDDVILNLKFNEQIEELGSELFEKTGVSLRLVVIKDLPKDMDMLSYGELLIQELGKHSIVLIFAQNNSRIDIVVGDPSLHEYFNKNQVLSPVASTAQAIAMGILFADSLDDFKELVSNSGGTILPLLGAKSKEGEEINKYSAALYNGYADIAGQVAESTNVELRQGNGRSGKNVLTGVKMAFYGVILMALIMYIRKKWYDLRKKDGTN